MVPLLQTRILPEFGTRSIPTWATVTLIASVLALVVGAIIASRRGAGRSGTGKQGVRYTRRAFSRAGRNVGLSREQTATLQKLVEACKVKQPLLVFSSPGLLDDVLKRAVRAIQAAPEPETRKQERLRFIYVTKQLIENSARRVGVHSTLNLRPGTAIAIGLEGTPARFQARLVANTREALAVSTPRGRAGTEQRWPKGSRCVVGFTRESDASYTFSTKVLGYNTLRGESCMMLQHAKTLRQDQQRKSRRREISRPCFVYPVKIMESGTGRRAKRTAVVAQAEKIIGTVSDISAGGCSVRAREPFKRATLVKVELSISRRETVAAFGKVQRVNAERQGGVMHIMFTRVSANTLNRIYSYVYDYTAAGAATGTSG